MVDKLINNKCKIIHTVEPNCEPTLANGRWMPANEELNGNETSSVFYEFNHEFDKLLIATKLKCQKKCAEKNLQTGESPNEWRQSARETFPLKQSTSVWISISIIWLDDRKNSIFICLHLELFLQTLNYFLACRLESKKLFFLVNYLIAIINF